LRRVRVTVPGAAVILGLWTAVPVTTATLVYAELLHPAFLLLPPAGSVAAVFVLLRIPAYTPLRTAQSRTAPSRTAARRTTAPAIGAAIPSAASAPGVTGPDPGKG
ncbi:undecaprenyl/decaprenyl-phosphate alpha-N-acetylglucosaminyl 1-phosphate transferase, partial [Streptomyces anulatus]|nr:undecaprenyl/decaprenyl-phosphate alpha-N-acetylglucosaminyl 1-phosphate transferase [Streptomyces anulatus]